MHMLYRRNLFERKGFPYGNGQKRADDVEPVR